MAAAIPGHTLQGAEARPEGASDVLHHLLQKRNGESGEIVQTGFSTNLAGLLDSPEDIALVRDKKWRWWLRWPTVADGAAEYNVKVDAAISEGSVRA